MYESEHDLRNGEKPAYQLVWDSRNAVVIIAAAELLAVWMVSGLSSDLTAPAVRAFIAIDVVLVLALITGSGRDLLYAVAVAVVFSVALLWWPILFDYEPAPHLLWGIVGLNYALFALWLTPRLRPSPYVTWPLIALTVSLLWVPTGWVLGSNIEWAVYGLGIVFGAVWLISLGIRPRPYATWSVLAVLVTLLGVAEFGDRPNEGTFDTLLRLGAQEGHRVASGEYWRLFTSIFLHAGYFHLIFNGVSILALGHLIERMYGAKRFLSIFLIAGMAGTIGSYIFSLFGWSDPSGGASGAAYGLAGALLVFVLFDPGRLSAIEPRSRGIAIILIGLLTAAFARELWEVTTNHLLHHTLLVHTGGFVSGLLLALALLPRDQPERDLQQYGQGRAAHVADTVRRWWALPVAAIVLALGVIAGDETTPQAYVQNAIEHRVKGDFTLARDEIWKAFGKDPQYGPAYLEEARILMEMEDLEAAQQQARTALHYELSGSEREEVSRILDEIRRRKSGPRSPAQ